jgi:predicted metal-dependent peptidase
MQANSIVTDFDLNKHTARLLMDEPFFAAVSRRIDKRASYAIPTAGVCVNPDSAQFEMLYNPNFFAKLTDEERRDVLKHEFYHIVFLHVTDRMPEGVNRKKWNIATDLAINSHLRNLPEGGLIPGEGPFEALPPGQSAEWYLANMPDFGNDDGQGENGSKSPDNGSQDGNQGSDSENPSEGDSSGSGGMPETLDSHDGWSECSQEVKDMAKERLKDIIRKAAEESSKSSGWGSIPASCKEEIMKALQSKINWKKVLRYFVKTSQRADKSSSIKRINRRYPYIHSGRKTNRIAKIAVSIDQSGSVDNEMLTKFFVELNKLADIAEFTVIPFDTRVEESLVYTWKKGESKKWERVMCGGTCFDAPTEYVNQHNFDGHIILTDMQAPKPKPSKCQRMWMTTPVYIKYSFETKEKVVTIE